MDKRKALALSAAALLLMKKKRTNRRYHVHPFLAQRRKKGEYYLVYCELKKRINQAGYSEKFFEYLRMDCEAFNKLYGLLKNRLVFS